MSQGARSAGHYLQIVLAAWTLAPTPKPKVVSTDPDSDVRMAAERLARELPRFHPSFRFEEALAATLSEAAGRMRLPLVAGGERDVVPPIRGAHSPCCRRALILGRRSVALLMKSIGALRLGRPVAGAATSPRHGSAIRTRARWPRHLCDAPPEDRLA